MCPGVARAVTADMKPLLLGQEPSGSVTAGGHSTSSDVCEFVKFCKQGTCWTRVQGHWLPGGVLHKGGCFAAASTMMLAWRHKG